MFVGLPPPLSSSVLAASCYVALTGWLKTHYPDCAGLKLVAILLPLPSASWNHQVPPACFVSWSVWVVAFWDRVLEACSHQADVALSGPRVPIPLDFPEELGSLGAHSQLPRLGKCLPLRQILHFGAAPFLFCVSWGLKRCMCVHAQATKRQNKLHISIS